MRKKVTTAKQRVQKRAKQETIVNMIEDPDFSLYFDESEEAHTIKPVLGYVPTSRDNWN